MVLLLAVRSLLVDQQYASNKAALHRNAHKTGLCVDQLMKIFVTLVPREPNPVFPLGAVVQYSLIQASQQLRLTQPP